MTLNIEISDSQAAALKAEADARGISIQDLVQQQFGVDDDADSIVHLQRTNPKEWARQFHEWAISHDRTAPPLSDEAMSRDSMYPDFIVD